jgi:hypothetical protein
MKVCNQCSKSKSLSEYYKMTKSKDGHQPKCKECCKIVNKQFRETKPEYQFEWVRNNYDKWLEYANEWNKKNIRANDKWSAIYFIENPNKEYYVGQTQTPFGKRKSAHKIQYRDRTACIPALHNSFDLYGYDNHKWYVVNVEGMDRETLTMVEYSIINHFNNLGISLNKRLK